LANKYPLTFLVAEDNKINRKLLVSMLSKFGYKTIHEAHDGAEAVRQMTAPRKTEEKIDVVLMDLWMPLMDGYEATERILSHKSSQSGAVGEQKPTVLAVTADVTDGAQERAARVGMKGFMTKPYKMHDLQRLITEYCAQRRAEVEYGFSGVPMIVEA
jgi:CheY-like chemotaxis protein